MLKKYIIPLLLLCLSTPSFSWTVSKISREITDNKNREYIISVHSQDESSVPIEVIVGTKSIDKNGRESYEQVDDHEFFIYPPIFVLQPGRTQKVRIRWTGDMQTLEKEKAFNIAIAEMPTKPKAAKTTFQDVRIGLNFAKKFLGSIYLIPKNAKANIQTTNTSLKNAGDDDAFHLTLTNIGNKYKSFKKPLCKMTHGEKTFSFVPDFDTGLIILSGNTRELKIDLPADWKEKLGSDKDFDFTLLDEND
ncbi:hypothetical protein COB21_00885 [Candidatus Aerophobetes bacterium]|uniref:Pili assembly chaperone N-terminal domain-containing protein n=1 Tax=Aerophobetes bacterium TaxID=2030807 RepID=A0A2A4X8G8_UNCAE|nr:MAG: hypothetical protein COB21_00885 [Candidatus Aerophobetes bacterium]